MIMSGRVGYLARSAEQEEMDVLNVQEHEQKNSIESTHVYFYLHLSF